MVSTRIQVSNFQLKSLYCAVVLVLPVAVLGLDYNRLKSGLNL